MAYTTREFLENQSMRLGRYASIDRCVQITGGWYLRFVDVVPVIHTIA